MEGERTGTLFRSLASALGEEAVDDFPEVLMKTVMYV
jgi:hypothetical protein